MYIDTDGDIILTETEELETWVAQLEELSGCRKCIAEGKLMLLSNAEMIAKGGTLRKLMFSTTCDHG